ncbi:hypothetical protein C5Y93_14830 [Blastopirellula marina]|uniref:Uncharacterized protein n=2 Tax=Blastopirellula marina TaxID=124 RepID=A0A2S8GLC1_9BACT|nr:hypothetical protein C5Y93_14830 [Blastopirellula marina]
MYEEASLILALFTFGTMGQGILITIFGLSISTQSHSSTFGFIVAGFGFTLIITQYASTYRRNLFCLIVASGQLAFCSFLLFLLLMLGGFFVLLPLTISVTTLLLNLTWYASLIEQREFGILEESSQKITLREIFGAILVLALILGPASFFYR